jgi:hypothetical protein
MRKIINTIEKLISSYVNEIKEHPVKTTLKTLFVVLILTYVYKHLVKNDDND